MDLHDVHVRPSPLRTMIKRRTKITIPRIYFRMKPVVATMSINADPLRRRVRQSHPSRCSPKIKWILKIKAALFQKAVQLSSLVCSALVAILNRRCLQTRWRFVRLNECLEGYEILTLLAGGWPVKWQASPWGLIGSHSAHILSPGLIGLNDDRWIVSVTYSFLWHFQVEVTFSFTKKLKVKQGCTFEELRAIALAQSIPNELQFWWVYFYYILFIRLGGAGAWPNIYDPGLHMKLWSGFLHARDAR